MRQLKAEYVRKYREVKGSIKADKRTELIDNIAGV